MGGLIEWKVRIPVVPRERRASPIERTVLEDARCSMDGSMPFLSGFRVGCSIVNLSTGIPYRGSNFEFGGGFHRGSPRAIHAEASAVDAIRNQLSNDDRVLIAVIGDAPITVTPCGECRDLLSTFFPDETVILAANIAGQVNALTLGGILPRNSDIYGTAYGPDLNEGEITLFAAAKQSYRRGILLSPELREGAAVLTSKGNYYSGARIDTSSYHPTSALESAIASAISAADHAIEKIFLITRDARISGAQRQRIFEIFDAFGRVEIGEIIVTDHIFSQIYRTSPRALLPHGYGMTTLGVKFEILGWEEEDERIKKSIEQIPSEFRLHVQINERGVSPDYFNQIVSMSYVVEVILGNHRAKITDGVTKFVELARKANREFPTYHEYLENSISKQVVWWNGKHPDNQINESELRELLFNNKNAKELQEITERMKAICQKAPFDLEAFVTQGFNAESVIDGTEPTAKIRSSRLEDARKLQEYGIVI